MEVPFVTCAQDMPSSVGHHSPVAQNSGDCDEQVKEQGQLKGSDPQWSTTTLLTRQTTNLSDVSDCLPVTNAQVHMPWDMSWDRLWRMSWNRLPIQGAIATCAHVLVTDCPCVVFTGLTGLAHFATSKRA